MPATRLSACPWRGSTISKRTFVEELCRIGETGTQPMESAQHHQTIPSAGGSRRGRLCQRPYPENGRNDGVPTLIQEQNSYAGVTNKLLAKSLQDMRCLRRHGKVLPAEKIIMTGNPVRQNLLGHAVAHEEAVKLLQPEPVQKDHPDTGRQPRGTYH